MASQINFGNHVNRMMDSMRGIQRILYVGSKIDLKNYPTLARLQWRCIYTSSSDENLAEVFTITNERQVKVIRMKEEYAKAKNKLDSRNPLLVYINGYNPQADESTNLDLLAAEHEAKENRRVLCESLSNLLKSVPTVELTIVGYNPDDSKEISPSDLYGFFYTLSEPRLFFYGLSESEEREQHIEGLVSKGIATVFSQDLGEALEQAKVRISSFDGTTLPEPQELEDVRNSVYINGNLVSLNPALCYDFEKYGRVLSIAEMFTGTITPAMQPDFFYQFLKRSPNAPQWYGYAFRNGFAVKRDYEDGLYNTVIEELKTNNYTPIILAGQSSSGKSIALGALAYRIYQEHNYPILFVNNPDISFAKGSPAASAMDNLLKEIRKFSGQTLVILDWSLYSLRNDLIRSISDWYYGRGQKVLFVVSAMNAPEMNDRRYKTVKAEISLSDRERKAFMDLVVQKGKLPRNRVEQWMRTLDRDPGLLSLLYTLFYDLHPQLEAGIKQEMRKSIADTKERILELPDPVPMEKKYAAWMIQLAERFPDIMPKDNSAEIFPDAKERVIANLPLFTESVAVASLFKLRMPLTLALHLLSIPECQNKQEFLDVVLNAPWLVYAMDDDRYAPGEYYVEFRAPIDARVYLSSIDKSKPEMMEIVAEIIKSTKYTDSFYSSEIRFLERLIRMLGPNSDDKNVREGWYSSYAIGAPSIISALSELRDSGIVEPLLVAQEITYIREYYGRKNPQKDLDLPVRINNLQAAVKIAREILDMVDRPNEKTSDWDQGLIDSITVESIHAELELENYYATATENNIPYDTAGEPVLYSYMTRSKKLKEIIYRQPENSYAYTALLRCFDTQFTPLIHSGILDAEIIDYMSDVVDIIDMTAVPIVESNEYYQIEKNKFLRVFDEVSRSGRAEKYFNELLERGSAVGVYIKARAILKSANIEYNKALSPSAELACQQAIELLENEEYTPIIEKHAASQYMRIRLTWLYYNKNPLFEREYQKTKLTEKQWAHLYSICLSFKYNIIDRQPDCPNRADVFYIMALACAQLGEYEDATNYLIEADNSTINRFERLTTWHVLCEEDGTRKLFKGTFNRGAIRDNYIYIEEMKRRTYYKSLQSINKSEASGEATDLCIGVRFRGFRAFAKNQET